MIETNQLCFLAPLSLNLTDGFAKIIGEKTNAISLLIFSLIVSPFISSSNDRAKKTEAKNVHWERKSSFWWDASIFMRELNWKQKEVIIIFVQ